MKESLFLKAVIVCLFLTVILLALVAIRSSATDMDKGALIVLTAGMTLFGLIGMVVGFIRWISQSLVKVRAAQKIQDGEYRVLHGIFKN